MPEAYLIVLISGKNAFENCKQDYFTFTQAYKEYKCFTSRGSMMVLKISKETFIKIFIDLIQKGFFKSKATTDLISVNNKVVLGIEFNELNNMIESHIRSWNQRALAPSSDGQKRMNITFSTSFENFAKNLAANQS